MRPTARLAGISLGGALLGLVACTYLPSGYRCTIDADCLDADGVTGTCEPDTSWCSFPDTLCEGTTRRYGEWAGGGLAGTCVGPPGDGGLGDGGDGAATGPEFPRLAALLLSNPKDYDQETYQDQIARLDLAVLGMYNGWERNGVTPAGAVAAIKGKNPGILLGNSTTMAVVPRDPGNTATTYKHDKLSTEVGPNGVGDWWAYDAAGQHVDSTGGGVNWDVNLTLLTTPDGQGDRWPQWLAKQEHQHVLAGVDFDLWFTSPVAWRPRVDLDWDRDGTTDSRDDLAVRGWWRDGQRAYLDTARATAPGLFLMLETDSDLDGSVYPPGADQFTQYQDAAHAAWLSSLIGDTSSVESDHGWATAMAFYRRVFTNLLEPRIVVFAFSVPSTPDYRLFRYALASALMDDGYFAADVNNYDVAWYDEYDLAGTASTKWLGRAVDPPPTAAWQSGVYRRRFEHGVAIVNPAGNGPRTVTLESGYRRFAGTQDSTTNDGQPAASITLAERDGILLVAE